MSSELLCATRTTLLDEDGCWNCFYYTSLPIAHYTGVTALIIVGSLAARAGIVGKAVPPASPATPGLGAGPSAVDQEIN